MRCFSEDEQVWVFGADAIQLMIERAERDKNVSGEAVEQMAMFQWQLSEEWVARLRAVATPVAAAGKSGVLPIVARKAKSSSGQAPGGGRIVSPS